MTYKKGDAVFVVHGGIRVGWVLTEEAAALVNRGVDPVRGREKVSVELPKGKIHFHPKCGGIDRHGIARTIADTTCKHCLLKRAITLCGWRWYAPLNAEDVAVLKQRLGERVAGFGERRPSWPPYDKPKDLT